MKSVLVYVNYQSTYFFKNHSILLRWNQHRFKSCFKAAVIKEKDTPIVVEEIERSKLDDHQLRIQVNYCSVNSLDCHGFRGGYKSAYFPFVPGYELSGEVVELGCKVPKEHFRIGERIAALCLDRCGGLAEECIADADDCWKIPCNVEPKDAAVLLFGHATALYTFSKLCTIKEKDHVMVTAGLAGLGLAAVDIAANMYKATVIAITDTEDRTEIVRERGAFKTIKFHNKLLKEINSLTKERGIPIIYDAVGREMFDAVGNCSSHNGKIFHVAPMEIKSISPPPPNRSLTMVSLISLRDQNPKLYRCLVSDVLELADQGIIGAHISQTYPLDKINDAIQCIQQQKCTGKVLIKID